MVYRRVKPIFEGQQPTNQIRFRSSVGVDDAFAVFENVCSKSMEWSVPMWCASLDLRKAFDRIEYNALFDALKVQGVPHAYLKLIASSYHDQVMYPPLWGRGGGSPHENNIIIFHTPLSFPTLNHFEGQLEQNIFQNVG